MNQFPSSYGRLDQAASSAQRNQVLRNTYWLLALSLLPTVLGAWIGVATGITAYLGGGLGMIVFLAGAFGAQLRIVCRLAGGLLGLACEFVCRALDLVARATHRRTPVVRGVFFHAAGERHAPQQVPVWQENS